MKRKNPKVSEKKRRERKRPFKMNAWAVVDRTGTYQAEVYRTRSEARGVARRWRDLEDGELVAVPVTILERSSRSASSKKLNPERTKPEVCEWTYDEYDDAWDTGCGEGFLFCEGGSRENRFGFCPFKGCGKKIKEKKGRE